MHRLCSEHTTDGRHKCATKGAIRTGNCPMPSIGLGRGRAVPDLGQGAGAQVDRARGGVAIDRGRIHVSGRIRRRNGTRQDGARKVDSFHRTRWSGGSRERPADGPPWMSRVGLPRSPEARQTTSSGPRAVLAALPPCHLAANERGPSRSSGLSQEHVFRLWAVIWTPTCHVSTVEARLSTTVRFAGTRRGAETTVPTRYRTVNPKSSHSLTTEDRFREAFERNMAGSVGSGQTCSLYR
jgi:hypothetical protein